MTDYARFRRAFAAALDPRLYPVEHLDALLLSGRAQAWFGDEAALVTELRTFPTGARAICVLVAAGDKDEIIGPLRERAEDWARAIGCGLVLVESRPGWARELKAQGYAPFQVALIKEL